MVTLDKNQMAKLKELCLWKFKLFCQLLWSEEWFDVDFHGQLCDFLEDTTTNDKLVVLPRGHLKTTIVATLFSLYLAVKNPAIRILIVCNSADNAKKTVREIRSIVDSNELFRALFPEVLPDKRKVRWTDECATLRRPQEFPEGTFESAGIATNIIRRHFDVIIEDDTVAPKKDELSGIELMPSRAEIEKAVNFHRLTIPLLVDFRTGRRFCVGTRWASYDMINHIKENELLDNEGRFMELDLPAFKEDKTPRYKRLSVEDLKGIKASLGPFMFSSLYLNDPLSEEFMKFRPSWINYYKDTDAIYKKALEDGECIVTVDPADPPTGKRSQDYCAIVSALHSEQGLFVRRIRRGRFTDDQIISHALDICELDEALTLRIEVDRYAHMQHAFELALNKRPGLNVIIEALKTRGRRKEARIMRVAPVAENGLLFLKEGMDDLESEMYSFPNGATDDVLDALAWHIDKNFKLPNLFPSPKKPAHKHHTFTFEEIMKSTLQPAAHTPNYPFEEQLGHVGLDRWGL